MRGVQMLFRIVAAATLIFSSVGCARGQTTERDNVLKPDKAATAFLDGGLPVL